MVCCGALQNKAGQVESLVTAGFLRAASLLEPTLNLFALKWGSAKTTAEAWKSSFEPVESTV